jgi:hypothetical protein
MEMASFGDLLLNMTGHVDPRTEMAKLMLGSGQQPGAGGTPSPSVGTPGAAAGTTGATAPGAAPAAGSTPPVAQAYASPPDLLNLYTELTDRQQRDQRINNGIGLIAAGFAQPDNRDRIMAAATAGNNSGSGGAGGNGGVGTAGGSDPLSMVLTIQQRQKELADKARELAALPGIAKQYGVDENSIRQLYDSGKLDEFLTQQNKPDRTTMAGADGKLVTVDQAKGAQIGTSLGPEKPIEGTYTNNTVDLANENASLAAQGKPPIDLSTFLADKAKAGAARTNINLGGQADQKLVEGADTALQTQYGTAQSAADAMGTLNTARGLLAQGIVAGSPLSPYELNTRKTIGALFGLPDEMVNNTEAYKANAADLVRAKIKALGSGNSLTDTDRTFTEQSVGSNMNIPPAAMGRIFNIIELANRNEMQKYNDLAQSRLEAARDPATGKIDPRVAASIHLIPIPPVSQAIIDTVPKEDLAVLAQIDPTKPPDPGVVHQFEDGDPTHGIIGHGRGSYQAMMDYVHGQH